MKRAIVTGASGFIGFHLVQELLRQDYEVLAVVRTPAGEEKINGLQNSRAYPVSCAFPDFRNLREAASGIYDSFFHMAWDGVSGGKTKDVSVQMQNVESAVKAVELAKELHCKRFIGAGSIHETECMKAMEAPERAEEPENYYKASKLAAHYYCESKAAERKIEFLWPRLTNTYGAGECSERLISSVIRQLLRGQSPALTDAGQLYNFIYITDAARAYRLIAERGRAFARYILGSETVKPLKEYLLELRSVVAANIELGFGEYPFRGIRLNREDLYSEEFYRDTGFHTEISFAEGIQKTRDFIAG